MAQRKGSRPGKEKNGNSARKSMRQKYGNSCMVCGWNYAPCDTHHIFPECEGGNHEETNLIVLCPNHHRMADYGMIPIEDLMAAWEKGVGAKRAAGRPPPEPGGSTETESPRGTRRRAA